MKHPNDSELVALCLGLEEDGNTARHLAGCEECRQRVEAFRKTLDLAADHQTPVRSPGESSDIFAAAWGGSKTVAPVSMPVWRRVLQPALVFACGILLGFVLFSDAGSGTTDIGKDIQYSSSLLPRESTSGKTAEGELGGTKTPLPGVKVASVAPSQTPSQGPSGQGDFWEMAGLRNVKLTPTVRTEDDREVKGAVLEGETLSGTLVVMSF